MYITYAILDVLQYVLVYCTSSLLNTEDCHTVPDDSSGHQLRLYCLYWGVKIYFFLHLEATERGDRGEDLQWNSPFSDFPSWPTNIWESA